MPILNTIEYMHTVVIIEQFLMNSKQILHIYQYSFIRNITNLYYTSTVEKAIFIWISHISFRFHFITFDFIYHLLNYIR